MTSILYKVFINPFIHLVFFYHSLYIFAVVFSFLCVRVVGSKQEEVCVKHAEKKIKRFVSIAFIVLDSSWMQATYV